MYRKKTKCGGTLQIEFGKIKIFREFLKLFCLAIYIMPSRRRGGSKSKRSALTRARKLAKVAKRKAASARVAANRAAQAQSQAQSQSQSAAQAASQAQAAAQAASQAASQAS